MKKSYQEGNLLFNGTLIAFRPVFFLFFTLSTLTDDGILIGPRFKRLQNLMRLFNHPTSTQFIKIGVFF